MQFESENVFIASNGVAAQQSIQGLHLLIGSRPVTHSGDRVIKFARRE
jgi:hypothetical protein